MITPAEFEDRMKYYANHVEEIGEEMIHVKADELMCAVLRDLGYVKGVEIFEQMPKWYS